MIVFLKEVKRMRFALLSRSLLGKAVYLALGALLLAGLLSGCGTDRDRGAAPDKKAGQTDFPRQKITFVVPVSPGGGFDMAARTLAPYLEKHLPNNVPVIIRNMPGGDWAVGINEVYKAQPDGYTICIFNLPGNVANQVVKESVKYDLTRITWLGRVESITYVAALSPKSKYQTIEQLKRAPRVNIGTVGLASTSSLGTLITAKAMGIKNTNPIPHDGSSEAILSAIRGDVDWIQYPYASLKPHIVDSQNLKPLFVFAEKRLQDLPDVPTVAELGYPELLDTVTMHRLVGTAPGVPEDIAGILRDAFEKAVNDPGFIKQMGDQNCTVDFADAGKSLNIVQNSIKLIKQYKDTDAESAK